LKVLEKMILSDGEEDGDGGLIYGYWRRVRSVVVMVEMFVGRAKRQAAQKRGCCCLPTIFCFFSTGGFSILLYIPLIRYVGTSIYQFFEKGARSNSWGAPPFACRASPRREPPFPQFLPPKRTPRPKSKIQIDTIHGHGVRSSSNSPRQQGGTGHRICIISSTRCKIIIKRRIKNTV